MVGAIQCYGIHNLPTTGHSQLVRSLERILEEANISGELILTNRSLKDFPIPLTKYSLSDTVIADLSRNRFSELPEEVTTFVFLETLLLYHNTIRLIPESVKQLTLLTFLDLRSNQLTTLPKELCSMPLQVLLVSNNRLLTLPDEIGRMEKLTDLDASYNQLTALPTTVGELRNLKSFSLRNNKILYLPKELGCLTLVSLDVSNNRIASLPLEIRQMTALVELKLENNPLISPPASLCVRGLVHVFKFLETQATKDEKGCRTGINHDGYSTLRRTPKQNGDSEYYTTCNKIDIANKNSKSGLLMKRKLLPKSTLNNTSHDECGQGGSIISKASASAEKQLAKKQVCFAQENGMNDDLIKYPRSTALALIKHPIPLDLLNQPPLGVVTSRMEDRPKTICFAKENGMNDHLIKYFQAADLALIKHSIPMDQLNQPPLGVVSSRMEDRPKTICFATENGMNDDLIKYSRSTALAVISHPFPIELPNQAPLGVVNSSSRVEERPKSICVLLTCLIGFLFSILSLSSVLSCFNFVLCVLYYLSR